MKESWNIFTIKSTGQRVIVYKKVSWNKIYFSFDGDNWSDTKTEAYKKAIKLTSCQSRKWDEAKKEDTKWKQHINQK